MVPLTLTALLLIAQATAIFVSVRRGIWRAVPGWAIYLCVATIHLLIGMLMTWGGNRAYPASLLYVEPLIIVGQIAFTFESSIKYLGISTRAGSPENRLILWMIPLVPAAIVLPIEIGFIRDALVSWNGDEAQSLQLVYSVRMFLSITLLVVLAAIPVAARMGQRPPQSQAVFFHHRVLTAYLGCGAIGYLCKSYASDFLDTFITVAFFVVGPLICFALWSRRMWNARPADLECVEVASEPDDGSAPFERRGEGEALERL